MSYRTRAFVESWQHRHTRPYHDGPQPRDYGVRVPDISSRETPAGWAPETVDLWRQAMSRIRELEAEVKELRSR